MSIEIHLCRRDDKGNKLDGRKKIISVGSGRGVVATAGEAAKLVKQHTTPKQGGKK